MLELDRKMEINRNLDCLGESVMPTIASNGREIDLSLKLHMINQCLHKKGKFLISEDKLSERIYARYGIDISPDECRDLLRRHGNLIGSNINYWLLIATATLIFSLVQGIWSLLVAIIIFPFIFICINEIITSIRLSFFDYKKLLPPLCCEEVRLGSIAIIIASRNEPFHVARMTFDSAISLKYPKEKKEIIVVDNSDEDFPDYHLWKNYVNGYQKDGEAYCDGVKVVFVHRNGTEGYKPANLDLALKHVGTDYILYLDVDSTLTEDSLLRVVPMFDWDKKLGFIQLFTVPVNVKGKSPLALIQGLRNYYLRLETGFYSHSSHTLFYGHNAVWRTNVVREIDSCTEYFRNEVVVTEDLSMSLRARFKGYYGQTAWVTSGEWVPESLQDTESMWLRWTVGTYQVYAKHLTKIENIKKLTFSELIGWSIHIGVLVNYGLLPLYVILGLAFKSYLLMMLVALSLLPEFIQGVNTYMKLSLGGMKKPEKLIKCYVAFMVLGSFINWVRGAGLIRFLVGKKQGWVPTGKSRGDNISQYRVFRERRNFIFFGVICLALWINNVLTSVGGFFENFLFFICGLYGFNCLLVVMLFGSSDIQESVVESVEQGDIKKFPNFY